MPKRNSEVCPTFFTCVIFYCHLVVWLTSCFAVSSFNYLIFSCVFVSFFYFVLFLFFSYLYELDSNFHIRADLCKLVNVS